VRVGDGFIVAYIFLLCCIISSINKRYTDSSGMSVMSLDTAHGLFLIYFLISWSQYSSHDISVVTEIETHPKLSVFCLTQ
jgi:hypothetical protein